MAKGIFGYFLSGVGLVAIIILVQRDLSVWYIMLAGFVFFMGIEFIIDDKIKNAKNEILDEINNK